MNSYVICQGEEIGDLGIFGPFEDTAWARAWIKQHDHDPYDDEPPEAETEYIDMQNKRFEDPDHWCVMGEGTHDIQTNLVVEPGFDPITLPIYE